MDADARPPGSDTAMWLFLLGLLAVLLAPLIFGFGLQLLPIHGDGFGTIGEALYLAAADLVLGVVLLVASLVTALRRRRSRPSAGPEDASPGVS